jgi:hypothetical protein
MYFDGTSGLCCLSAARSLTSTRRFPISRPDKLQTIHGRLRSLIQK